MGNAVLIAQTIASAARTAMATGVEAVVAAAVAPACAACARPLDAPLAGPVCSLCWDDARRAAGRYDGALRSIIHAFKYDRRRSLARPLGAMLREAGAPLLCDAACVVPVPLFPWRRLQRGFNQAADLAMQLGPPVVHALWRVRPTASQAGLTAAARRRNVREAFRLSPLLSARRQELIDGRIVVLVDDVMTTGATLGACAAVLSEAGAREVRMLTLAEAPLEGQKSKKLSHRPPHVRRDGVAVPVGVDSDPSV